MESKKGVIWITIGDDSAEGVFDTDGNLITALDIYHGDNGETVKKFCEGMEIPIKVMSVETLLVRDIDEGEFYTDSTNEIPLLEEIQEAIKGLTKP